MKESFKFYRKETVLEAARERMRWIFGEFENVNVSFSGGKDSTVTLHLALEAAEEAGRLPLPVLFVDQEAEWDLTIEYVRTVMNDPRVKPYWYQIPFRLFNAATEESEWLMCWDPKAEADWIRPREPNSIHETPFKPNVDRFYKMFTAHLATTFSGPVVNLAGIRCSESMSRFKTITQNPTYKWATWGKVQDKAREQYNLYPLYDWTDTDIWKAIHDHGWGYCKIYDIMYQYGIPLRDMRVSSLTHETAMRHLVYLQEFEGDTWSRVQRRLKGVNTAKHLEKDMTRAPRHLPYMFESWREYRDYLLEHLIKEPEYRAKLARQFKRMDLKYRDEIHNKMHKVHITAILSRDRFRTKEAQFANAHAHYNRYSREELAARKEAKRQNVQN